MKREISEKEYQEIYNDVYENCKETLCSKGCYDSIVITKFTNFCVAIALKKMRVKINKELD